MPAPDRMSSAASVAPSAAAPVPAVPSARQLAPLRFTNVNTRQSASLGLYDRKDRVDEAAATRLDLLLGDARRPGHYEVHRIDRRLLQLVYRAAYHFSASEVRVISAYRRPGRRREGLHALGRAIDFKLLGVPAATLASYLRHQPRVGVGVYTHPRTQFVHLDVRDRSFHWLDASPPHKRWREKSLHTSHLPELDATYRRELDWPEGVAMPASSG